MAKKRVSSIKELKAELNKLLLETLKSQNSLTAEEIKIAESDMVEQEVYAKYKPSVYERRGEQGGLADIDNMKHFVREDKDKVVMSVKNLTPQNTKLLNLKRTDDSGQPEEYQASNITLKKDGYLAQLVEGGEGNNGLRYLYNNGGQYLEPRPFQQRTIEELKSNKKHVRTLAYELKQKGLDAKPL